jgi:hypothetical protein
VAPLAFVWGQHSQREQIGVKHDAATTG